MITIGEHEIRISQQEEQNKNVSLMENKISQREAEIKDLTKQLLETNGNLIHVESLLEDLTSRGKDYNDFISFY